MSNLTRVATRFEIAVGNFVRSAFDLAANEKAFQAWYAASVIQEFGTSRVYREVHFSKRELAALVSGKMMAGFERGNELFPDLSVSWSEAVDARHTSARPLDAAGMLDEFAIISEFKTTASTLKPTSQSAIRRDMRKLGIFSMAHANSGHKNELATYMVILDNRRRDDQPTRRYSEQRTNRLLDQVRTDWPESAPWPIVLVGEQHEGEVIVSGYS